MNHGGTENTGELTKKQAMLEEENRVIWKWEMRNEKTANPQLDSSVSKVANPIQPIASHLFLCALRVLGG
jgi:hypothetical protein